MNHMETLLCEWYALRGYFVLRNIRIGLRKKGGYNSEIDILAFHPETDEIVQVESSLDTASWQQRIKNINKKFDFGEQYVKEKFGIEKAKGLSHKYVLMYGAIKDRNKSIRRKNGEIISAQDEIKKIVDYIKEHHHDIDRTLIHEQYPLLRTIQFVNHYFTIQT